MSKAAPESKLPEYAKPPVSEVAFGVLFQQGSRILLPHIGAFWAEVRSDFPRVEEAPPLFPVVETFGDQPSTLDTGVELPIPRSWFVSEDERALLQLQKDRFHYNWRKRDDDDEYPRFPSIASRFFEFFGRFRTLTLSVVGKPPAALQYELSYINTIALSGDTGLHLAVQDVLRDFEWGGKERSFLPAADNFTWELTFRLPDEQGRLHCIARTGRLRGSGGPVLSLELTARGMTKQQPDDESLMKAWFDLAHEWVVRGFTDLTTKAAQDSWGRIR
jgi:uncharacterized protein (TIGR04255 family)